MRTIQYDKIVEALEVLCIEACHEACDDVTFAIEDALKKESHAGAARIMGELLKNAEIAKDEQIPLCQDTGLAIVFVDQGADVKIASDKGKTITDAINEGIESGYQKGYLRKSVVADPLNGRNNTGTNTPAIIHHSQVKGDKIKIALMAKGGGCENKSQFKMFKPTADRSQIVDWVAEVVTKAGADACPPFVIGLGIGGDFELSCLLSKRALLRDLRLTNSDPYYAELEADILSKVNASGIGPQGLGGDTTALACLAETAPCHIASLPVAVNIECHAHRHKTVVL